MSGEYGGWVQLSIEAFPGRFSPVLQHEAERCHVTKSLCRVSALIAAVFLLGIDSNASIEVDSHPSVIVSFVLSS